jgi:PAS domain S-box-containing protein
MPPKSPSRAQLTRELDEARARLEEAEDTLRAIRAGEVDALVVSGEQGEQVYALRGAEYTYRVLVEQMNQGAATLSAEGVLLYGNRRLAELLGAPLEQVIGRKLHEFVGPGDQAVFAALLAAAGKENVRGGLALRTAAGSSVPVSLAFSALPAGTEAALCLVATDLTELHRREAELERHVTERTATLAEASQDLNAARIAALNMMEDTVEAKEQLEQANRELRLEIAERKRAEAALGAGRTQLQFVADHAPVFIAHCDHARRYKFVNQSYAEMFGLRPADLVGRHPREMLGEAAYALANPHMEAALAGQSAEYDLVLPLAAGARALHVRYAPERDASGRVVGFVAAILDVTARREVEAALRESEAKFRALAEESLVGVYVIQDGRFKYVNAAQARILGYTAEELLALPSVAETVAAEDRPLVAENLRRRVTGETKGLHYEFTAVRRNGERRRLEVLDTAITFAGRPAVLGTALDVTDRKQAETDLVRESAVTASMARLAAQLLVAETLDDVCSLALAQARRLIASPYGFAGYVDPTTGCLVLPTLSRDMWDQCQVAGKKVAFSKFTNLFGWVVTHKAPLLTNTPASDPRSVGLPAGHIPIERFLSVPVLDGESLVGQIAVANGARDYTAADLQTLQRLAVLFALGIRRKRAEESLRVSQREIEVRNRIAQVFLTVPDEAMYAQVQAIILEATASESGVFGYLDERGDFVVPTMTRTVWDKCQVPDKRSVFPRETWGESSWPRAVREKRTICLNEPSTLTPEGHLAITRHISLPLIHQGEVVGLIQVANKESDYTPEDVALLETLGGSIAPVLEARLKRERQETARKQAEQGIRQLNADLERRVRERTAELELANHELEAFSYSVSHDLRAPLRGIDGWSQALLEDYGPKLDAQAREYLGRVCGEAQWMGQLIDEMLNLSRVSRQSLESQPVATLTLVSRALERLHAEQAGRQIDLVLGELPPCQGDPRLLEVVWVNLLANALKFTRHQPAARIEVGAIRSDEWRVTSDEKDGPSPVTYFVRDNGAGFDMAHAGKLFVPFQRLHRQSEFPGTGVGLATVQRIIRRHGGRVWAEGEVGKGATFYFTLAAGKEPA